GYGVMDLYVQGFASFGVHGLLPAGYGQIQTVCPYVLPQKKRLRKKNMDIRGYQKKNCANISAETIDKYL
ncbi:MAG: hypothetical protein II166_05035, partial [Firmicutes bacterium]|nr:hypothetical protein [Bacillota bacterium]